MLASVEFSLISIGVFPRATTVVVVGWSLFAWEKLERRRGLITSGSLVLFVWTVGNSISKAHQMLWVASVTCNPK